MKVELCDNGKRGEKLRLREEVHNRDRILQNQNLILMYAHEKHFYKFPQVKIESDQSKEFGSYTSVEEDENESYK